MKRKKDDLNKTIKSLGPMLKPDWDRESSSKERITMMAGPNTWEIVKNDRSKYGRDFDYRILDGSIWMPSCTAAQQWLYSKITEDQHWYGDLDGFVGVRVTRLDEIREAARRDGLIDEAEYIESMNENDALALSGEDA